jgi:hypothetical protein
MYFPELSERRIVAIVLFLSLSRGLLANDEAARRRQCEGEYARQEMRVRDITDSCSIDMREVLVQGKMSNCELGELGCECEVN